MFRKRKYHGNYTSFSLLTKVHPVCYQLLRREGGKGSYQRRFFMDFTDSRIVWFSRQSLAILVQVGLEPLVLLLPSTAGTYCYTQLQGFCF